jgi:hypothetical protein
MKSVERSMPTLNSYCTRRNPMKSFLLSLAAACFLITGCDADRTDVDRDPDVSNDREARETGRDMGREARETGRKAKEATEEAVEGVKEFGRGFREGVDEKDDEIERREVEPDNDIEPVDPVEPNPEIENEIED